MDVVGLVTGLLTMNISEALGIVGFVLVGKWIFGKISLVANK